MHEIIALLAKNKVLRICSDSLRRLLFRASCCREGRKRLFLHLLVVTTALLYLGALVKINAVVVLDGGKFFVSRFDGAQATTKDVVHLFKLNLIKPFLPSRGVLVKHSD